VHDWAEVHRLYEREDCSKMAIARRLAMSRNTVDRLLALEEPPRYERSIKGSLLDAFKPDISEMLELDAEVPATVILSHLQERGYRGRITILKDYLQAERPRHLAARSFQRTSYAPGELGQFDWWELPIRIPVGKGRFRKPYGLVATLPHSAGHETVFTFSKTMGDFCPAFLGTLERFGGYAGDRCQETSSSSRLRRPSKIFWRPTWPLAAASSRWRSSVGLNSMVVTK